jgi:hypothetical protein
VRIFRVTGTSTAAVTAAQDRAHLPRVGEQGGAGQLVADLLGRAAHVDVDDLGAAGHVVARRLGHPARLAAGDLHDDRAGLAVEVAAQARQAGVAQCRVGRQHLGHHVAGAEFPAQAPEKLVGHAHHRRQRQGVVDVMRSYLHGLPVSRVARAIFRKARRRS